MYASAKPILDILGREMRDDSEGAKRYGNMSMQSFGEQIGAGDAMPVRADFLCMDLCRPHAWFPFSPPLSFVPIVAILIIIGGRATWLNDASIACHWLQQKLYYTFTHSRVVHTCTYGERSVRISQHVTKYYVFLYSKLIEFNLWHEQRMWFRFCFILCLQHVYSLQDRPLLGIQILSTTTSKRMRKYKI